MCGFLLTVGDTGPFTHRQLGNLRKRGPDGIGFWSEGAVRMAQTRLSVVGLDDRSLPPLASSDHAIVFNGEIYNFADLMPRAINDTHALFASWRATGANVLPRLHGIWSFAVYDRVRRRVHLVRDQFGARPLYYRKTREGLVAGSTLAAVRDYAGAPNLNEAALSDYVRYQMAFEDDTFLEGIKRVSPGAIVTYDLARDEIDVATYENIWRRDGKCKADEAWTTGARELLTDCVREAQTSDVGYATTCSGGLDSSLVTRIAKPERAWHGNYSDAECNETQWARAAVDGSPTRLMTVNCADMPDLVSRIESIVEDFDDPAIGSAILPLDDVLSAAQRRDKVVLLGTGGDELFAGYVRYELAQNRCSQDSYRALFDRMRNLLPSERFELAHRKGEDGWYTFTDGGAESRFFGALENAGSMLNFDRRHFLEGLLTIDDRIAGRHGVEGRPALLHQKFVRHVVSLDPRQHVRKSVLKEIARGILPDSVIDRSDKMGFTTPIGTMVNANIHKIREMLTASRFRHLYNLGPLHAATKFSREVFGLVLLDCWLRRYA